MLIETAVRRNSAQYFLLTPKLLPNLNYDRGVTVLIVYNGDDMAEFTRWNNDEFLTQEETYRFNTISSVGSRFQLQTCLQERVFISLRG